LFIVTDMGPFRFSIGTAVFIFAILNLHDLFILPTATLLALVILFLRIFIDYFSGSPAGDFNLEIHQFSGALYFLVLSVILRAGGLKKMATAWPFPVKLVMLMGLAVMAANFLEAAMRVPVTEILTFENTGVLLLMSAVQVFLVMSLTNISHFQQVRLMDEQEKERYERMIILASELFDEFFYMKKSAENIENIMAKSYDLHRKLKEDQGDPQLENKALEIAEEVHEVKKDTYRIMAGISRTLKIEQETPCMYLSEILDLVIKSNRSYSQEQTKLIQFNFELHHDLELKDIYPLLAILNNLVSNAIEAINEEGYVSIRVNKKGALLQLKVCDDGPPINKKDRRFIFEPGFTTKFSPQGVPSTGIGLAYVRALVESFRGRVWFQEKTTEKCFVVMLPLKEIRGEEY